MTIAFDVAEQWRSRTCGATHLGGTVRALVVTEVAKPRHCAFLERLGTRTGAPVALNPSLNRRGGLIASRPPAPVAMFLGADPRYLVVAHPLIPKGDAGLAAA